MSNQQRFLIIKGLVLSLIVSVSDGVFISIHTSVGPIVVMTGVATLSIALTIFLILVHEEQGGPR